MRQCIVSVNGGDSHVHTIETDAASLFEAAYSGLREWSGLWWFSSDLVIEVRAGEECWNVKAQP